MPSIASALPAQGSTNWTQWAADLDAAVRRIRGTTTQWGTLGTETNAKTVDASGPFAGITHIQAQANYGMEWGEFDFNWQALQPNGAGTAFDTGTVNSYLANLAAMKAAGQSIEFDDRTSNPPAWMTNLAGTGQHYVDEAGGVAPQPNYVFSQSVRNLQEQYDRQIFASTASGGAGWDINDIDIMRIGSGANSELLYPRNNGIGHYYAFDPNVLGNNPSDLPADITPNPFPAWRPGGSDTSITPTQVQQWFDWYNQQLVNYAEYRCRFWDSMGFTGMYAFVVPAYGIRPRDEAAAIAGYLPISGYGGAGGNWHHLFGNSTGTIPIANDGRRYVQLSSVGDQSGNPNDNVPTDADTLVPLTDPATANWSQPRMQVRVFREYEWPMLIEGVGHTSGNDLHYRDTSTAGEMYAVFQFVDAVKPVIAFWAHSDMLWDGTLPNRTDGTLPIATTVGPQVSQRVFEGQPMARKRESPNMVGLKRWLDPPFIVPTLNAAFTQASGKAIFGYRVAAGWVELTGVVQNVTAFTSGGGLTLFRLPDGPLRNATYERWPSQIIWVDDNLTTRQMRVKVQVDGNVVLQSMAAATAVNHLIALDGVRFRAYLG